MQFLKPKFFSADEVEDINYAMRYTPDVWLLGAKKYWNLFVYSSDQFTHPKMFGLDKAKYWGYTCYTSSTFALWTKELGGETFSIMLDDCSQQTVTREWKDSKFRTKFEKVVRPERVRGELVQVTPQLLYKLDEQRLNTVEYARRRVSVTIPFRFSYRDKDDNLKISETYTQLISAWCYVGKQEFWDKQIDGSLEEVPIKDKEGKVVDTTVRHKSTGIFKPAKLFEPADSFWPRFYHHSKLVYDE